MTKRFNIKKITLALVVIAALFASGLVIACDHHDLGDLPLDTCPICAASHVLSSAGGFSGSPAVVPGPSIIAALRPFERTDLHPRVHFAHPNYRAPPAPVTS